MKTIIIEIHKDASRWKMSSFYKSESMAHRQYSTQKLSEESIREICADIFNILSRVDHEGKVTANSLEELRKSASLLYDQAFSKEIKDEIRNTDATHLIFYVDEELVYVPWELLHDGINYLCLRFATGRVVLTSHKIQSDTPRDTKSKLKMMVIGDPTGDLKKAYEEGIAVRNELDKARDKIRVDLRTTDVDLKYIMKNIRDYDLFHFAGHAKYDQNDPSKSGLVLKDGDFTTEEIMALSGSLSMPSLVFANACASGETEGWRIEPAEENRIYGLANTFLLAGVKHYIGTFWKVQDVLSLDFAKVFYRNIRESKSIGEALRGARLFLIEKYGQTALIWASYTLYGDPGDYLAYTGKEAAAKKFTMLRNYLIAFLVLATVGVLGAYNLLKEDMPQDKLKFDVSENVFYAKNDCTVDMYDTLAIFNRNIALGKKMHASTVERENFDARFAADGNLGTRWASKFSDPQWIYVDLGRIERIGQIRLTWEKASARLYEIQISNNAKLWKTVWRTSHGGGEADVIDLRKKELYGRYVRMYAKKRATDWGYSLWEFEVYNAQSPNIAVHKTAFASSGRGRWGPNRAVDGDMGTRWGSDYSDPQWIYVDLRKPYRINMVTVYWEPAYGSVYKIQRSDDGKNWIDVSEINNNGRKINNIYFESPFVAQYVKLYGLKRGTEWGYSIWELEVHGIKENTSQ